MSYETGRAAAARDLAAHLALARARYGIPLGPDRAPGASSTLYARYLAPVRERFAAGASVADIAAELGIPPNSVTNLIGRARRLGDWPPDLRRCRGQAEPALT